MSRKESRSYQLTVRLHGLVAERVRATAKEHSISLNQAVVRLLERGAGLEAAPGSTVGRRLQHYSGVLSDDEAAAIEEQVDEAFGRVDPGLWK